MFAAAGSPVRVTTATATATVEINQRADGRTDMFTGTDDPYGKGAQGPVNEGITNAQKGAMHPCSTMITCRNDLAAERNYITTSPCVNRKDTSKPRYAVALPVPATILRLLPPDRASALHRMLRCGLVRPSSTRPCSPDSAPPTRSTDPTTPAAVLMLGNPSKTATSMSLSPQHPHLPDRSLHHRCVPLSTQFIYVIIVTPASLFTL
ncbi:hypothetical protein FB566_4404 [Stackebrandtia endophytica]|uniref:Uncharacterized protein n=1 Tax=Stackebrandtia endophytica TaxID=1496996 RepID=A0A543B1U9_9ACTN|nr:hypothetical protein FB566_4404 [Stackebrandtia endophytica]